MAHALGIAEAARRIRETVAKEPNPLATAEMGEESNYNMIDGIIGNSSGGAKGEARGANPLAAAEMAMEQNYNMIDGIINNRAADDEPAKNRPKASIVSNLGKAHDLDAPCGKLPGSGCLER
jgi:hypothetical protein